MSLRSTSRSPSPLPSMPSLENRTRRSSFYTRGILKSLFLFLSRGRSGTKLASDAWRGLKVLTSSLPHPGPPSLSILSHSPSLPFSADHPPLVLFSSLGRSKSAQVIYKKTLPDRFDPLQTSSPPPSSSSSLPTTSLPPSLSMDIHKLLKHDEVSLPHPSHPSSLQADRSAISPRLLLQPQHPSTVSPRSSSFHATTAVLRAPGKKGGR